MSTQWPAVKKSDRLFLVIVALAWLLLLWVCYRGAFDAPFYGDTVYHLQERTNLHLTSLSWGAFWDAAHLDFRGPLYRPLSNWSLALTHYFWGLRPTAYRAGNLLIHWGASLALLFLFLEVLRTPRARDWTGGGKSAWVAAVVGVALWSLHPIQTNVVTYVIQRMASLTGLFTFLCIGSYLRGRSSASGWSWSWGGLGLASLFLALGSKENAFTIFPLLLLCEAVLLVPDCSIRSKRVLGVLTGAAVLAAGALLWFRGPALWAQMGAGYQSLPFTPAQRLLTETRLQLQYLLTLLVPDPRLLVFDAQTEVSTGLFSPPATGAALIALIGALVLAVRTARTRPLLSFGILWFVLAQATESTVLPLELYFEHRMYIPSVFLYLGAGFLFARAFATRRRIARGAAGALLAAALAVEAWATVNRNALWAHPVLFWADAVDKAPQKARTHLHFAEALIWHRFYPEAEKELDAADRLGGWTGSVAFNRGTVAYRQNQPEDAEKHFREAGRHADVPAWLVNGRLADLALEQGRAEEALALVRTGLREKPDSSGLWALLGRIRNAQGRAEEARTCFLRALSFDPANRRAREDLGRLALRPAYAGDARGTGASPRSESHGREIER